MAVPDQPIDLVDDRALEAAAQDRLRHEDVAVELARVIAAIRSPASIALYGPWGSGKSGLANLVGAVLAESVSKARFVRFDAFKYAETPLRRHFISQVARALGIKDEEFGKGLYRTVDRTDLTIPKRQFWKLLGVFALAVAVVEFLGLAIVAVIAAVSAGPFGDRFNDLAGSGLALALAPAGLLAAFVALLGQTLPIKRTTSAPSSEEQFEECFENLVRQASADPLVIFIDELDRCSPKEVVATLEAIRTFLDVNGVIYVVAADQQVLERALREEVRQTTPADIVNPYYSAGSAYLDKVFQYQLSLPPLMPRRLSNYALDVVADLGGVWNVVDREEVVSTLVPTHVRSPRRVKRLLNGFIVAYRLVERRIEAGQVEGNALDRAAEIAKLVCLQIEFPLFAADLALDARLPEYVLQVRREGLTSLPEWVPAEVKARARDFASKRAAVDQTLPKDDEEPVSDKQESSQEIADDDQPVEKAQLGPVERDRDAVREQHAAQLIRYLQKTAHVSGPGRDLIHLEGGGALFGLDSTLADQLEDAAVDGEREAIRAMIAGLDSAAAQRGALQLLAQRGKEASIGIEGQNVVSCLLGALSDFGNLDIGPIADDLGDAVAAYVDRYELRTEDLAGALALGTRSSRAIGARLIRSVIKRDEPIETELGLQVLEAGDKIPTDDTERLGRVAGAQVAQHPKAAIEHLVGLDDHVLAAILTKTGDFFVERLAAARTAEEERDVVDEAAIVEGLKGGIDELARDGRDSPAQRLAQLLLAIGTEDALNAYGGLARRLAPIDLPELIRTTLGGVLRRTRTDWPDWLDPISIKALAQMPDAEALVTAAAGKLWDRESDPESASPSGERARTLKSLTLLSQAGGVDVETLGEAMRDKFGEPPMDEGAAETQAHVLAVAYDLVEADIIRAEAFSAHVLDAISQALETNLPAASSPNGILATELLAWCPRLASDANSESRARFCNAVETSPWCPSPARENLTLCAAAAISSQDRGDANPYTPDAVADLVEQHGGAFALGLATFIREFSADAAEAAVAVAPLAASNVPGPVAKALEMRCHEWTPDERAQLVLPFVEDAKSTMPTPGFLVALHYAEADHEQLADALVDLYRTTGNNDHRERVLRLWQALGKTEDGIRRRLIEDIAIPMAQHGKGALDLVLRYLEVAVPPPHGTKQKLRNTLRDRAKGKDQRKRVDQALLTAGLTRRSGLFRRGREDM